MRGKLKTKELRRLL